jgi:hypothetical protein
MAPKRKDPPGVASMNPDNMVSGGLMDDFDGLVTRARLCFFDYEGKGQRTLAVALAIKPDDDDEFTQHYSSGNPEHFSPTMDGVNPAEEGVYALPTDNKSQMNNNTNWAHFTLACLDAGFAKKDLGASVEWVEGLYGHFNRVPQRKRSGIQVEAVGSDGRQRSNDILVVTEIKTAPAGAGAGRVAAATGKGKALPGHGSAGPADSDLDARLSEVLLVALAESEEGIPKTKLAGSVIKSFTGAEKAKAVKRVNDLAFLEAVDGATFDADSATLFLG